MALRVKFPFGILVDVFPTHVDDTSGNVFLQISNSESGKLDELMNEIEEFVKTDRFSPLAAGDIDVGSVYLALFSIDARWYRARVLAVKSNECEVFFVDYGNIDQIPLQSLRKLPENFLHLPPQVFECELNGVDRLRGPNFKDTVNFLGEQILEQDLVCRAVSLKTSNVLVVDLFTDTSCSKSVLDLLLNRGLACSSGAQNLTQKPSQLTEKKYKNLELPLDNYEDFYITSVKNPDDFTCQRLKNTESIQQLMESLAEEYTDLGPQDLLLQSCVPRYPCCARFSEDGGWYRALITKVGSVASGFIEVKFVDYGNTQQTPLTDVRELKDKFLELPAQAIECAIHGVKPFGGHGEWPEESLLLFKKLTEDKHMVALVDGTKDPRGKYQVKLFDTTGDMDLQVNQILIAAGYATKIDQRLPGTPPAPDISAPTLIDHGSPHMEHVPPQAEEEPSPSFPYRREHISPGSEEKVLITAAPSPSKFYCQLFKMSTKLEKLMMDIENHYIHLGRDEEWLSSPSVGDICCAQFTEDNCWYRAVVTELLPTGKIGVLFVDYGNSETLPPKCIKKLVPRFSDLPSQGIECLLNRICPLDVKEWRKADIRKFYQIALEMEGKVTVVAQQDNGAYRVELVLGGKQEFNVSEKMLLDGNASLVTGAVSKSEHLHSIVSRKYAKLSLSNGSYEDIFVSYSDSPESFWCQLSKHKNDLDTVMNLIHEYCASSGSRDVVRSPSLGMPCCAMFSQDEAWYRGSITGIIKGNKVEVHFVDYGNSEVMPSSNLRVMKTEFMNVPAQAFKCELDQLGCDSNEPFSEEVNLKFDELTAEKELVGMIVSYDDRDDKYIIMLLDNSEGKNVNILESLTPLLPQKGGASATTTVPQLQLKPGTRENVCVTSVTSLSQFYCQVMRSSSQLDDMMQTMDDHYNGLAEDRETLSQVTVGGYCVAKYTEDDSWYRAKITAMYGDSAEVHYIDYGNSETLQITRLKKLASKFAELPEQIVACSLSGDKSGLSDTQFTGLVFDKKFHLQIVAVGDKGVAEVELISEGTKQSVKEQLSKTTVVTPVTVPMTALHNGCKEPGFITSVINMSKFYFQPSKSGDSLDEVMNRMESYYSGVQDEQDTLENPQVHTYCAAKFTDDDGWYRARVSQVHGNSIDVLYIDYGNSEVIPVTRAKVLKPEFASLSSQAIECCLYNAKERSGEAAVSEFQELVLDKLCEVHVRANRDNGVTEVELIDINTGCLIGQGLPKSNEIKDTCTGFKPSAISFSEGYSDIHPLVCHNPHQFYCQFLTTERIVAFGQLIDKLKEYYSNVGADDERVTNPAVDMPCCVLYAVDGTWNRATITQVVDSETVMVYFVDYGNVQPTPLSNIKTLKQEFMDLEAQATMCSISTIKPTNGTEWSNAANERFTALVCHQQLVAAFIRKGSDDSLEVDVFNTEDDLQDVNIAEVLVKEGLATFVSDSRVPSSIQQTPVPAPADHVSRTLSSMEKIKPSMKQELYVTAVDSPEKFYCQLAGSDDRLATLMENLAIFYESLGPDELLSNTVSPGELCCALYSEDNGWYRALIEAKHPPDSVIVRFIDYGNTETVKLNTIKSLTEEFLAEPVMAIECKLSGVCPPENATTWSQEATNAFQAIVKSDKVLAAQVKSTSEPFDVVLLDGPEDVAGQLIKGNFAVSSKSEGVSKISAPSSPGQSVKQDFKSPVVTTGALMQVYITDFSTPGQFHCQLAETGDDLDAMMNEMNDHYTQLDETESCLVSPSVGQACVAIYDVDDSWYRARVQSLSVNDLTVLYVDYGNAQNVKPKELKQIEPKFLKLPLQAIECTLDDKRLLWNSKETEMFQEMMGEKTLAAKIVSEKDGKYLVKIYGDGNEPNSEDFLSKTGDTVSSQVREDSSATIPQVSLKPGQQEEVYVSYVSNPTQFAVQVSSSSDQLDEVMANVAIACASSDVLPPSPEHLQPGFPCCALFTEDNSWYRAVIKDKPSNTNFRVEYIDYGNEDTVARSNLRSISEQLVKCPQLAIHCILDCTAMEDVTKEAFENIVMDKPLVAKFLRSEGDKWVVDLSDGGMSIADMLSRQPGSSSQGHEKVVHSSKENMFTPGEVSLGYVSHVENDGHFYIQLTETEDLLDGLMGQLTGLYPGLAPSEELLKDAAVGSPCCALFSEDGVWYRANITNIASNSEAEVEFIDYGNRNVVPLTSLKKLLPEFQELPRLAVLCKLADTKSSWTASDSQLFESRTLDKPLEITFGAAEEPGWLVNIKVEGECLNSLPEFTTGSAKRDATYTKTTFDKRETAYFLSAESMNAVWLQPVKSEGELTTLMDTIATSKTNESLPSSLLKVGQPCLSQFTEDDVWYRAEIISVKDSSAHVRYVDYGNSEWLPIERLSPISERLLHLPAQAIRCSLHGVQPAVDDKAVERLHELCLEKTLEVELIEQSADGVCVVRLFEPDSKESIVEKVMSLKGQVVPDQEDKEKCFYSKAFFSMGQKEQAYYLSFEGVDSVWLQPVKSEGELTTLMDTIATSKTSESLPSSLFKGGQPCLSQFTEDDVWYRAEIISVKDSSAHVRYVDYGNSEWLPIERLSPISERLLHLPAQAIRCSIHGVQPTVDDKAVERLHEFCVEKTLEVELIEQSADGVCVVRLFEPDSKESIVEKVMSLKGQVVSKQEDKEECFYSKAFFSMDQKEQAYYLSFEGVDSVWLQPVKSEGELTTLMDTIATSKTSESLPSSLFKGGQPCLSQFTEDDVWYRAEIISVKDSSAHVRYVDYGNSEWLPIERLSPISKQLLQLPSQAIRCSLHGVQATVGDKAVEKLNELCLEKTLEVELIEQSADGVCVVRLFEPESPESVNQRVCLMSGKEPIPSELVAPVAQQQEASQGPVKPSVLKADLQEGTRTSTYFLSATSPIELQLQLGETDELASLMELISTVYTTLGENELKLTRPCVGQACCAQFPDDNEWYRAEIQNIAEELVTVLYVDHGNTETIPNTMIRQLTDEFIDLPAQYITCSLHGISPCLDDGQWSSEIPAKVEEFFDSNKLTTEVMGGNNGVFEVNIVNESGESLADYLIRHGYAVTVATKSNDKTPLVTAQTFNRPKLLEGTSVSTFFTGGVSPYSMLLQLAEEQSELKLLMEQIDASYSELDDENNILDPVIGQVCCAQYSEDEQWYRAEMLDISGECSIHVKFVDYGNCENVPMSKIKHLKDEFLTLPAQAIECSLSGVIPAADDKWDDDCIAWMEENLTTELRAEIVGMHGGGVNVYLYFNTEEGENSVVQTLVDLGYGKQVERSNDNESETLKMKEDPAALTEINNLSDENEEEIFEEAVEELPESQAHGYLNRESSETSATQESDIPGTIISPDSGSNTNVENQEELQEDREASEYVTDGISPGEAVTNSEQETTSEEEFVEAQEHLDDNEAIRSSSNEELGALSSSDENIESSPDVNGTGEDVEEKDPSVEKAKNDPEDLLEMQSLKEAQVFLDEMIEALCTNMDTKTEQEQSRSDTTSVDEHAVESVQERLKSNEPDVLDAVMTSDVLPGESEEFLDSGSDKSNSRQDVSLEYNKEIKEELLEQGNTSKELELPEKMVDTNQPDKAVANVTSDFICREDGGPRPEETHVHPGEQDSMQDEIDGSNNELMPETGNALQESEDPEEIVDVSLQEKLDDVEKTNLLETQENAQELAEKKQLMPETRDTMQEAEEIADVSLQEKLDDVEKTNLLETQENAQELPKDKQLMPETRDTMQEAEEIADVSLQEKLDDVEKTNLLETQENAQELAEKKQLMPERGDMLQDAEDAEEIVDVSQQEKLDDVEKTNLLETQENAQELPEDKQLMPETGDTLQEAEEIADVSRQEKLDDVEKTNLLETQENAQELAEEKQLMPETGETLQESEDAEEIVDVSQQENLDDVEKTNLLETQENEQELHGGTELMPETTRTLHVEEDSMQDENDGSDKQLMQETGNALEESEDAEEIVDVNQQENLDDVEKTNLLETQENEQELHGGTELMPETSRTLQESEDAQGEANVNTDFIFSEHVVPRSEKTHVEEDSMQDENDGSDKQLMQETGNALEESEDAEEIVDISQQEKLDDVEITNLLETQENEQEFAEDKQLMPETGDTLQESEDAEEIVDVSQQEKLSGDKEMTSDLDHDSDKTIPQMSGEIKNLGKDAELFIQQVVPTESNEITELNSEATEHLRVKVEETVDEILDDCTGDSRVSSVFSAQNNLRESPKETSKLSGLCHEEHDLQNEPSEEEAVESVKEEVLEETEMSTYLKSLCLQNGHGDCEKSDALLEVPEQSSVELDCESKTGVNQTTNTDDGPSETGDTSSMSSAALPQGCLSADVKDDEQLSDDALEMLDHSVGSDVKDDELLLSDDALEILDHELAIEEDQSGKEEDATGDEMKLKNEPLALVTNSGKLQDNSI